ncbi:flagellar biosynthesis protein FlhB [Gilvimarinus polysaccharolyticus]|uniref:flagellar biosynthesis protein FlhB n=1 Tax=Gilvimarinus polysaccharolyticus TaxID=863921 RepID=UPI0006737074|nr:flagellar biosynthesis protein FlhB [Gilvimarinus polysaccharolyticus]
MAEAGESSQEKTEEATPRKLEKAREDGQIPRSRDLTSSFILLAGSIGLYTFAESISGSIMGLTRHNFTLSRTEVFDPEAMIAHLASSFAEGLFSLIPLFLVLLIASVVGPIALGGWLLSAKAMAPKMSRMSLGAGLKRMFAFKALVELLKALGKVITIMFAAIFALKVWQQDILQLAGEETRMGVAESLHISGVTTIIMAAATIIIALIDVPFQIADHSKKLKMSRQEIKDESKDSEGKPEVKGRIRQLQREMAQRRMMSQVPEADVVITNPTHYAVALKYDPEKMATPIMVAKGGDQTAFKIREIAKAHGIEIIESPMLARSIFHTTDIDETIPTGLYVAVAQVLAYVFGLRNYRRGRGERPQYPRINVPRDLQYD